MAADPSQDTAGVLFSVEKLGVEVEDLNPAL